MTDKYDVEVRLVAITVLNNQDNILVSNDISPDCEQVIEFAGRLCWDTVSKIGSKPNRIQEWVKVGHESVIEHASATFYVRASRVFTHELVRHRLASYSQRSQRYVKEAEPKYITPPELKDNEDVFKRSMQHAWSSYRELLNNGVEPEIARYVLPNACETQIVMTMNFRELRHFIKLRTDAKALPEMKAVANKIRLIMKEQAPKVFRDL